MCIRHDQIGMLQGNVPAGACLRKIRNQKQDAQFPFQADIEKENAEQEPQRTVAVDAAAEQKRDRREYQTDAERNDDGACTDAVKTDGNDGDEENQQNTGTEREDIKQSRTGNNDFGKRNAQGDEQDCGNEHKQAVAEVAFVVQDIILDLFQTHVSPPLLQTAHTRL